MAERIKLTKEDFSRTWVNSESFPFLRYDGYRVLHNETIYEWKKKWWIFGKWLMKKRTTNEVCVLDEAVIR